MSDSSGEIKAIGAIAEVVEALEEDQRGRVIRYIVERFNIVGAPKAGRIQSGNPPADPQVEAPTEFEDFASLVDASHPGTDAMRALVAGYWLQVCNRSPSFDAQSANSELKNLGHPSSNITSALGALINQKPALVLQLRKSGNSKQARKSYKITESGIRKVKEMMRADSGDSE